jgi:hypothetical protein
MIFKKIECHKFTKGSYILEPLFCLEKLKKKPTRRKHMLVGDSNTFHSISICNLLIMCTMLIW